MNKRFWHLIFLLVALVWGPGSSAETNHPPVEKSFLIAKHKAAASGKAYVVQFYADWCTPCTWMNETAFYDARIASLINDHYIFVRVDIEAFEGQTLKEYFRVHSIPSLLIFRSDHSLAYRQEGALHTDEVINLLERFKFADSLENEAHLWKNPESANKALPESTSTWSSELEKTDKVWSIQIGAFGDKDNAKDRKEDLEGYFEANFKIISDHSTGHTLHRLYLGEFASSSEAENYMKRLSLRGISGIVKKVSLSENL